MITVSISGRKATLLNTEDLPTGNDSSIKVNFIFDDSDPIWKNSRKLAIFYAVTPKGLKKRLPAVITDENECYIPGKIISTPYSKIEIGVTSEHEDGSSVSTNNVFLNKTKPGAGGDSEFDYDEQPVNKNDFDEFLTDLAVSVDSKIFELQSDLKNGGYVKSSDLPTKTSELENDSGFITESDLPTKTSQLVNDSGFTTASDLPTKTSELENDSGYITADDLPADGLPTVTEADNGKVLRVVDGVWAADTIQIEQDTSNWELITEVALDTETAKYILCSCDEYDKIEIMIKRDSNNTSLTGNMFFEIVDSNGNSVVELYSNNLPGYREKMTIMEVNSGYAHCIATTSNNIYSSNASLSRCYYVGNGCKYCLKIPKPDTACDGLSTMTVIGRRR